MSRITPRIHSVDGLEHPMGIGLFPYVVEERPHDLTLIDTCFIGELKDLEAGLQREGYEIKDVKRLILTHTHSDHAQAAGELKKISGAKVYSHWIEASFLKNDPPYHGPPTAETIGQLLAQSGKTPEELGRKYGPPDALPITVDQQLNDGDAVGGLKVIHTPGHTPGHISLFSQEDRAIIGGDFLFKFPTGLSLPIPAVTIDPVVAALSVRRVSQLHFDKLLLAHQDSPMLENAARAVEQLISHPSSSGPGR